MYLKKRDINKNHHLIAIFLEKKFIPDKFKSICKDLKKNDSLMM